MTFGLFFYWKQQTGYSNIPPLLSVNFLVNSWMVWTVQCAPPPLFFQFRLVGNVTSNTRNEVPLPPIHQWFGCMTICVESVVAITTEPYNKFPKFHLMVHIKIIWTVYDEFHMLWWYILMFWLIGSRFNHKIGRMISHQLSKHGLFIFWLCRPMQ